MPVIPETPQHQLCVELSEELSALNAQGLRRALIPLEAIEGACVRVGGRFLINWCSNDYLGLSTHPALREAADRAVAEWGVGARASRLLTGTTPWHLRLERSLAAWFGAEAAVVYPSGYLANLGTLGTLVSSEDVVVVDRCAHASLFDAARASRATLRVFQHNDPAHAAHLLSRVASARRRFILTEGLFSMEGDHAPLADVVDVAEAHDALVYLDDAHGAFVTGATGRGTPEAEGIAHERLLYMGTLGKALGCQGGFVVGPQVLIDLLHHQARTFIYTTALAVPLAAAAVAALEVLDAQPDLRERLGQRIECLRRRWAAKDLMTCLPAPVASHIIPVIVGSAQRALEVAEQLQRRGHWALAIRPPTVPRGRARLRVSLTAAHTESHLDQLVQAFQDVCAEGSAQS